MYIGDKEKCIIANCKSQSSEGIKLQVQNWDWFWKSKQIQAGMLSGINILHDRRLFGYGLKQNTGSGMM